MILKLVMSILLLGEIPMAKAFSVVSWNVEHFKDDPARMQELKIDILLKLLHVDWVVPEPLTGA